MTDTLPAPAALEALKEAARRRAAAEALAAREAEELEEKERLDEWARLMEQVRRDHPYLGGCIDDQASSFTRYADSGRYAEGYGAMPDRSRPTEAVLYVALPAHEPVGVLYGWDEADGWTHRNFCMHPGQVYRVASDWHVAPDRRDGVESGEWLYFADLGEALVAAEESHKEKCARTQEAVKRRQQKAEAAARAEQNPPLTAFEQMELALRAYVLEVVGQDSWVIEEEDP